MLCSNATSSGTKWMESCRRPPWMIHLEDQCLTDDHLCATYQNTRPEHNMKLDIRSSPKLARLTKVMVTLVHGSRIDFCFTYLLHTSTEYSSRQVSLRGTLHSMFDIGITNSYPDAIVDMMTAGANIVRLNMSHQQEKWHAITVQSIREAGNRMYEYTGDVYPLGVAMNLRGPEIRTGIFNGDETSIGYAQLKEGDLVRLVTNDIAKRAGRADCFWVSYSNLPQICRPGDKILIDRGAALLQVKCICKTSILCKVVKGGVVRNEKLVQLLDSVVSLPQISETDNTHVKLATMLECDIVIANHVRNEKIIHGIKSRLKLAGADKVCVMAKISTQQGLENFDEILNASDGILLDRNSIEIDTGPEKLFLVEKVIIAKCMNIGKPVMLAFNVGSSKNPKIDMNLIANAVLTGSDGIFLKTGTLNSKKTIELLKNVDTVCREAESARWQKGIFNELSHKVTIPLDLSDAIIVGAIETSLKSNAAGIIIITTTGRSAVLLSIHRPRCPIVAITRYGTVARWLQLYYGLHPFHYRNEPLPDWTKEMEQRIQSGIDFLWRKKFIKVGDAIVVVSGWSQEIGFTNCLRIIHVSPGHIEKTDSEGRMMGAITTPSLRWL